jgi:hypothetical protein
MAARRAHQDRALAIIATLEGEHSIEPEVAIPQASRVVDGVARLGEPSDGWGPIRPLVAHRTVLVEHFSRPPSLPSWVRSVATLAWLVDAWWTKRPAPRGRAPMLLVLSNGTPRTALAAIAELRPFGVPGIWLSPRPALGDLLLVDIKGLPPDVPGTSVLRLVATPTSRQQADAHIGALRSDSALVQSTKDRLLEALMDRTIPSTDEEQLSILERVRREGHREGRDEGRREGRDEGRRQVVLALLAKRLGDDAARELDAAESTDELERRLAEWIEGE